MLIWISPRKLLFFERVFWISNFGIKSWNDILKNFSREWFNIWLSIFLILLDIQSKIFDNLLTK